MEQADDYQLLWAKEFFTSTNYNSQNLKFANCLMRGSMVSVYAALENPVVIMKINAATGALEYKKVLFNGASFASLLKLNTLLRIS